MSTTELDRGHSGERSRDLRIDFARGVALLIIFSDHVRGNVVAEFTPQALGFSDGKRHFGSRAKESANGDQPGDRGFISTTRICFNCASSVINATSVVGD